MSLGHLFEQTPAEFWCRAVGLDPLLYEPFDDKQGPAAPLRHLLGVLVGAVGYETRFGDALRRGDLPAAGAVLRRLPTSRRAACEQVFQGELQRLCDECTSERAKLLGVISDLERRRNLQDQDQEFLAIGREELRGLTMPTATAPNPIEQLERCRAKIREWSELVCQIQKAANDRWIGERKRGFELQRELLPLLEERILSRPGDSSVQDALLLALPSLIVNGQHSLLDEVKAVICAGGDPPDSLLHRLRGLLKLDVPQMTAATIKVTAPAPSIPSRTLGSLSAFSHVLINRARPLEEPAYVSASDFRDALSRRARTCVTNDALVDLLSCGAATLRRHGEADLDLVARALFEEGCRVLIQHRYSQAQDLFLDSFKLWTDVEDSPYDDREAMQRAASGMVLAAFLLRSGRGLELPPQLSWLDSPLDLLTRVTQSDLIDPVVRFFFRLSSLRSRTFFLEFLQMASPAVPWRELVLIQTLEPRRLLADFSEIRNHIDAVFDGQQRSPALGHLLSEYLSTLEKARLRERIGTREVAGLQEAINTFNRDCPASASSLERTMRDALAENIKLYQANQLTIPRIPLQVATVALTKTLYPGELEGEPCQLVFSLTLHPQSEVASALAVELTIKGDEELRKYVSVPIALVEVGTLEPGEVREVAFHIQIQPQTLSRVSEILVETTLREGSRPVGKGRILHHIALRPNRPQVSTRSPFTHGKSLSAGDLFVGREKELSILYDNLLGDVTEKIPLVIGIRRIGKTTILKRLAEERDIRRRYYPVLIDLEDMSPSRTTADFLLDLATRIRDAAADARLGDLSFKRADFQTDCIGAFERLVRSTERLEGSKRILLIFDEFEKLLANLKSWGERQAGAPTPPSPESALVPETLAALRKAMLHAPRVSFVVCGVSHIWNEFQSYDARMFGLMNPVVLQALDESSALKLINVVKWYQLTDRARKLLLRMSGRQPYLLQVLSEALFQHMKQSGRDVATATDVEEVIERKILPNEAYLTDYMNLVGDDALFFRSLAMAHRRVDSSRIFVPFEIIYKSLLDHGLHVSREQARQRLLDESRRTERPLIQQNPSNYEHFGLTIGLLIPLLARGIR